MEAFPSLLRFLEASSSPVVVTDALAQDQPIVLVNPAFEAMTGYRRDDLLGRNCRILQGTDRDQPARGVITAALAAGRPCECELRNYRRDGTMFWNRLYLFLLRNDDAGSRTLSASSTTSAPRRRRTRSWKPWRPSVRT